MNTIIKPRYTYPNVIKDILLHCNYKNNALLVKGSSNDIYNIGYFADYDLYSNIFEYPTFETLNNEITRIMNYILTNKDIYFMELKFQIDENHKLKYYPNEKIIKKEVEKYHKKGIEYFKIDLIVWIEEETEFKEASINYSLKRSNTDPLKKIDESLKEEYKEGNYLKYLKRLISKNKIIKGNEDYMEDYIYEEDEIRHFLNIDIGNRYVILENLNTIKELEKYYNDELTKRRIYENLKKLRIQKKDVNNKIKELTDEINKESYDFIKLLDL
jgi:hypothetical protein